MKKAFTVQSGINLMTRDSNVQMAEKDVAFCFGMSKMSVVNELTQSSKVRAF